MLNERVVFITGAGSGIGYALAEYFVKNGAYLAICDINEQTVEQAGEKLKAHSENILTLACDVTNEQQMVDAVQQIYDHYGKIDVLINNAGKQHIAKIEEFPSETFEQLMKIMLVAPFLAMKYVLPYMKKQQYGRILNIASINGLVGFAGKAAYNSAKHGVIGLTKVAALECASDGVTVNALCPGYVDTPLVRNQLEGLSKTRNVSLERVLEDIIYPLVPQRRLLDVEEVAHYAMFLASEQGAGVTGQAVVIDGGYTAQ
ncbi:3-hydroxybutyrate dehydrogenase [Alkalihalobacterium alkalinitrilicum]|uniref:3-hydroxybutyrate dehydrogenase n=1 Tax=Alkalihalobacterium alkalinitrilicum TaxID=427920 RepID=UPI00099551F2|nr:3-hydroxybutyrate dehydrogenase [Alkalihalobacterium alkalinitrilicum]